MDGRAAPGCWAAECSSSTTTQTGGGTRHRADAAATLTAAAQAIFSYDYKAFDASVANGESFTTGDFTAEYTQTTANLKTLAVQQQAVVRAEVSAAGVVDEQPGRVELLHYVNEYRRNTAIIGETVDQNREESDLGVVRRRMVKIVVRAQPAAP